MNRAVLLRVAGAILIMVGMWSAAWGVRHLSAEPMRGSRLPYASSRQLQAIAAGMAFVVLGFVAYRTARHY